MDKNCLVLLVLKEDAILFKPDPVKLERMRMKKR